MRAARPPTAYVARVTVRSFGDRPMKTNLIKMRVAHDISAIRTRILRPKSARVKHYLSRITNYFMWSVAYTLRDSNEN